MWPRRAEMWLGLLTAAALLACAAPAGASAESRIVAIRTLVEVENRSPDPARDLVLTLPATVASGLGRQRVLEVRHAVPPSATRVAQAGGGVAYRVPEVAAGERLVLEQVYIVELAADATAAPEPIPPGSLAPEPGVEADHPALQAAARQAVAGAATVDQQAEALVRAVVDRLTYDAGAPSAHRGALAGYESGRGLCQEYASLFVALSRAADIPARLVYGWVQPNGLAGALTSGQRHVWAQYHHPEWGWVSVDPTLAEGGGDPLGFDHAAHIAQGLDNATLAASYGGQGLLRITQSQSAMPVAQLARE